MQIDDFPYHDQREEIGRLLLVFRDGGGFKGFDVTADAVFFFDGEAGVV